MVDWATHTLYKSAIVCVIMSSYLRRRFFFCPYSYQDDEYVVNDNQVIQDLRVEIEHKMAGRYVTTSLQ